MNCRASVVEREKGRESAVRVGWRTGCPGGKIHCESKSLWQEVLVEMWMHWGQKMGGCQLVLM